MLMHVRQIRQFVKIILGNMYRKIGGKNNVENIKMIEMIGMKWELGENSEKTIFIREDL